MSKVACVRLWHMLLLRKFFIFPIYLVEKIFLYIPIKISEIFKAQWSVHGFSDNFQINMNWCWGSFTIEATRGSDNVTDSNALYFGLWITEIID